MKYIFILAIFSLFACSADNPDHAEEIVVKEIMGISNESNHDVEITFFVEDSVVFKIERGAELPLYDSLYRTKIPRCKCGLFYDGCDSKPINLTIKFMGNPNKCVHFIGNIKDSLTDIRSITSYQKKDESPTYGAVIENLYYEIDSKMESTAQLCELD